MACESIAKFVSEFSKTNNFLDIIPTLAAFEKTNGLSSFDFRQWNSLSVPGLCAEQQNLLANSRYSGFCDFKISSELRDLLVHVTGPRGRKDFYHA